MSYYKVLGVETDASLVDINRAYRKLSLQFNPEKNLYEGGFYLKMFNQVQEAYAILNNEEKRKEYDIENGFINVEERKGLIVDEKEIVPPNMIEQNSATEVENKIISNKERSNNEAIKLIYVFIFLIIGGVFCYSEYKKPSEKVNYLETESSEDYSNINRLSEGQSKANTTYQVERENDQRDVQALGSVINEVLHEIEEHESLNEEGNQLRSEIFEENIEANDNTSYTDVSLLNDKGSIEYFMVGSSRKDVKIAQGNPISVDYLDGKEIWFYGWPQVIFKNGKVVDFVDPYDQLNVR